MNKYLIVYKIKLLLLLFLILSLNSCKPKVKGDVTINNSQAVVDNDKKAEASKPIVEQLTNELFKEKVYDYSKSKEWKYEGTLPCIIDFYADWCGPCKMMAPVLKEIAEENKGKIKIYKINIDEQKELAMYFRINNIPTFLFCPVKGLPRITTGMIAKDELQKTVNELLIK